MNVKPFDTSGMMRTCSITCCSFLAALFITSVVGCGDTGPKLMKVSGTVTIDGEPLSLGVVRFIPEQGEQSIGPLDKEGRFVLKCRNEFLGAYPGRHRIAVYAGEILGETKIRWHAPKKYAYPATTPLTETVEAPIEDMVIELEWGKKKGPYVEQI